MEARSQRSTRGRLLGFFGGRGWVVLARMNLFTFQTLVRNFFPCSSSFQRKGMSYPVDPPDAAHCRNASAQSFLSASSAKSYFLQYFCIIVPSVSFTLL